jgi:Transposase, Mutator family
VRLVVSDAHSGLKMAIASILQGASWQRCRTHTIRAQSPDVLISCRSVRRRAMAERDHVADLQRILADDDAFDHQVQQDLALFERRLIQTGANAFAECGQVGQYLLGSESLAA